MDFEAQIDQMSEKIGRLRDTIETEEATKNAFIMPFIGQVLGYDVFDPSEVTPEFVADVGLKKGEKVDYALFLDGQVQILIECKKVGTALSLENASQLFRYFACTRARIGVLTNGQVWNFYMDLDEPNRMDSKPFLVLDLLDVDRAVLPELQKLSKPSFDIDSIASSAEELKYVSALKRAIADEFKEPSDAMVKLLAGRVYDGPFRQNVLEKFRGLVEKSMKRFMNDKVNERLTTALGADDIKIGAPEEPAQEEEELPEELPEDGIITTEEEIAAYRIVKAIACSDVDPERITMRDAKSYCAIFLDDNNRKPVVRLYFNTKNKTVALFEDGKMLAREPISGLNDLYRLGDAIRAEVRYLTSRE